jgi:hypothetical protein
MAVSVSVARLENPAVEMTRASGRSTASGERCSVITRELILTGTPRYLRSTGAQYEKRLVIGGGRTANALPGH